MLLPCQLVLLPCQPVSTTPLQAWYGELGGTAAVVQWQCQVLCGQCGYHCGMARNALWRIL